MQLTKVELENFRNYKQAQVSINSDLVLILGENATGKTNFLESLYYLSTLKSFRGPESLLARHNQDYFRIKSEEGGSRFEAVVQIKPMVKRALKIDDAKVPRAFWKSFATVLFVPPDLNLFTLGPLLRRKLLDDTIGQIKKKYAADLISLDHVLKQRAALLIRIQKQESAKEELGVWNQQMAELVVSIGAHREEFIDFINSRFDSVYRMLTGFKNSFNFWYKKTADSAEEFLDRLNSLEENEIKSGQNLAGSHREDWTLNKDGLFNVYNSSRGELRSQILAIKLIQADYLNQAGFPPVMLLDDVFSELDETRRAKLLHWASPYQIFITTTEEHHLPQMNRIAQTLRVRQNAIGED